MIDLQTYIRKHFYDFYNDVYISLQSFEPADPLTNNDVERLIGIVNSIQLRYEEKGYEYIVAGTIVHTAMDHLLVNGNKRLSLILGYFCAFWHGHIVVLMQGNFARLIKQIVIDISQENDRELKEMKRLKMIEALANEIKEYSIPRGQQKLDCGPVASFILWIKTNIGGNLSIVI